MGMTRATTPPPYLYLLAADTTRARAYFDMMQKNGLAPALVLLLGAGDAPAASRLPEPTPFFDNVTPLARAVIDSGIPHQLFTSADVNADDICAVLSELPSGIVIFAPAAGLLARAQLFETGHKLLHVHPGRLPEFRGSTPMYYSLIAERRLSASAIFLEPEIDVGPVLAQRDFPLPEDLRSIDAAYDPYIRAVLLCQVLKDYSACHDLRPQPQGAGGTTYHVIHPVLKHLALLGKVAGATEQEICK
jgi:methionyl-tRNA formyltransferase